MAVAKKEILSSSSHRDRLRSSQSFIYVSIGFSVPGLNQARQFSFISCRRSEWVEYEFLSPYTVLLHCWCSGTAPVYTICSEINRRRGAL